MSKIEELRGAIEEVFATPRELEEALRRAREESGAEKVGIAPDTYLHRWSGKGFIYRLHIRRTRFTTRLDPEDVGLDPHDPEHRRLLEEYVTLGEKHLLPKGILRRLDRVEKQMRRLLAEKYGIPTAVGYFVPFKNVPEFLAELRELEGEYLGVRDEILRDYDALKARAEEFYRRHAEELFRRLGKAPVPVVVEKLVSTTMAAFPSKERIRESFRVELEADLLVSTEFVEKQRARLELLRKQEELLRRELELEEQRLSAEERMQRQLELERLRVEREVIRQAVEQKARALKEQVEGLFSDLAGAAYGVLYDAVKSVQRALEGRREVGQALAARLRDLAEKIRLLAVEDTEEIRSLVEELKRLAVPEKSADQVREALGELRYRAASVLVTLPCVPRALRDRGVSMEEIKLDLENVPVRRPRQTQIELADVLPDAGGVPVRRPRAL
ncbi:hypothetical protein Adeg_0682 [Ammonifex degensii KC4]|uniref:Uncharacterized protein n=1 Tax=Ammonifex degensii (strain DSM 10501 / KC4) TaxID=429009 RepID=C9RC52_AMMDK|nr:DUF3150 domain-containing protein [Ammonifex degensii]ACX51829.1 hypothetical protein Adeg_0682 [Ammonifex degensii KC4]